MSDNLEAPREPNDLFNKGQMRRGETQASSKVKTRVLPLGQFSEFILTEQPRLLSSIRAHEFGADIVVQRQQEILANLDPEIIDRATVNPFLAKIAMLDLTFAINAAIFAEDPPSGSTPPDEVEKLSSHFAQVTGLPRTMTFEKIVGINSKLPFQQMRTFTNGKVGKTERKFYYRHDLMDTILKDTTGVVSNAIDVLTDSGKQGVSQTETSLVRAADNMNEFSRFMTEFMQMPRTHFTVFRQYLSQYPDGTRNASGAFIGMPRLNLRLMGSVPFYEDFLNEGMQYFPVSELPDIKQAHIVAQQGNYLVAICEKLGGYEGKSLAGLLIQLIKPLHQFRLTHYTAVLKYLPPQAIPEGGKKLKAQLEKPYESILEDQPGVIKGTGGFSSGPLLRNMLRLDLKSLRRLRTISEEGEIWI